MEKNEEQEREASTEVIKIVLSILLLVVSFFLKDFYFKNLSLIIGYVIVGLDVYLNAVEGLRKKDFFNENTLMIIATISAIFIGNLTEAVLVMLLFTIGELLSELAVNNSKKSIKDLLGLRVETVNLEINNELVMVSIESVKENEIFVVVPGESIPLDGIVVEGESQLDTSHLTGESRPRKVSKDSRVLSGCINQTNILKIKATSTYENTTTTKIIDLISDADNKKSSTEKFITKFSNIYTKIVVILAILLTAVPTIFGGNPYEWLYRSLVFLVTACPCALVISIPLGYFCGIGKSSHEGILIKGSSELEKLNEIDYIALDKTGTITKGVFEVVDVYSPTWKEDKLLQLAASAEKYSQHPIAKAISEKNEAKLLKVSDFEEISGKGIKCTVKDKNILIGNEKLFKENNIMILPVDKEGSIVHIAINEEYAGYIVISDKIKKTSLQIHSLKNYISKDLIILSGDISSSVKDVAKKVGIKEYYSELLPQDKVKKVKELKKTGKILFVGDGINDAPVIKIADLGVSMGKIGTDAAIEASDIVIMKDDLMKLKTAFRIARSTTRRVKQNIVFAITIKVAVLVLGILGISSIWMAVFADVGVMLISILNVLSIIWKKYE